MKIGEIEVLPGQSKVANLGVGKIPTGNNIFIHAHVYRSKVDGPTILLSGGMHGDEVNGVEVVRRMIVEKLFDKLKCGTVIATPLLNVYGFINFSRAVPDGKDVNRSFPGIVNGSLASRVARTINNELLPLIDLGIDYHCGGENRYNYPQIRCTKKDKEAYDLAKIFGAPFLLKMNLIRGSMRKIAHLDGIPILIYEGGESLRLDEFSIKEAIAGTRRVLHSLGMIDAENIEKAHDSKICDKTSWIRAATGGIFFCRIKSGNFVKKGDVLGEVCDPYGTLKKKILAKRDGYIIGHNNTPVVYPGDALFHIALETIDIKEEKWGF